MAVDDSSGPASSGNDDNLAEELESESEDEPDEPSNLVVEDDFDVRVLPVRAATKLLRDGLKAVYDVQASKMNPFLRSVSGVVPDSAQWDLQAMELWLLSYWDEASLAFKAKGKRHHALVGYNVVSGSVHVQQETSKPNMAASSTKS